MEKLDILETCLYVDDLDAAETFYCDILKLQLVSKVTGRHVFFRMANSMLLLFKPEASGIAEDLPPHGTKGAGHICFKVTEEEYENWKQHLRSNSINIIAEQGWRSNLKSFYFHDPAGNVLEVAPENIWA